MNKYQAIINIRTRKIGLLLLDVRTAAHRSAEACAALLNLSLDQYLAYEKGRTAPSLPELEALAVFLGVSLKHFWGSQAVSAAPSEAIKPVDPRLIQIRTRILGAKIRQERSAKEISLEVFSEITGLPAETLEMFELGRTRLTTPQLEACCAALGLQIETLFEPSRVQIQQENIVQFKDLPEELQNFVSKPINRPYLELAVRLSEMSVDKLRLIAEGLLEITY